MDGSDRHFLVTIARHSINRMMQAVRIPKNPVIIITRLITLSPPSYLVMDLKEDRNPLFNYFFSITT